MGKPKPDSLYRTFMTGFSDFLHELKAYNQIRRSLRESKNDLTTLTRKEIEIYFKIPQDLGKVAPVLLLFPIPILGYAVFPLVYFFPRQILTDQFWNRQQRMDFNKLYLKKRLRHYEKVFHLLKSQQDSLKKHKLYQPWKETLNTINKGLTPSTQQIIGCKNLFAENPYSLENLSNFHIRHLLKCNDIQINISPIARLTTKATFLIAMDRAIMREGGVHNMHIESLKKACLFRGVNPFHMEENNMISWLRKWIEISKEIDHRSVSLLLHCPILLGFNEPSNKLLLS